MSQRRLTFDDFSGGEFDRRQSFRASKGQFTGTNVIVGNDGSILPRNGLKQIALTGTTPTGRILGMGENHQAAASTKRTWFVIGTGVYLLDASTGACVLAGNLGATPTVPVSAIYKANVAYLFVDGNRIYKLDHGTATLSTPASFPTGGAGYCAVWYDIFAVASAANSNRLYFSDAGNPESWTSTSFVDIGNPAGITGMWPGRDGLIIAKGDGSWWILRGTPPIDSNASSTVSVRQVLDGVSPANPENAAMLASGLLAYTIGSSSTGSVKSIGFFNGSSISMNPDLFFGEGRLTTAPEPSHRVVGMKEDDDLFILGANGLYTNKAIVRRHGIWTKHEFALSPNPDLRSFVAGVRVNDVWLLTDGGAPSVVPKFYLWRAYNQRPAFTSDTNAQPGDASTTPLTTCEFTLPEFYAEDGKEIAVQAVVVDFTSYNTGSATNNNLTVTPTAVRLFEGTEFSATAQSYGEPGSGLSTSGTTKRKRFDFGDSPFGNGFRLKFSGLKGVVVHKVQVHLVDQPARY